MNDAVLAGRDPATRDDPHLSCHLRWVWDGRPVAGRHVLVRCYHDLGDMLQFARFLPALRRRAASVTVEAPPALAALMAGIADVVVPFDIAAPLPPSDCDLEIMELAHALRLSSVDVPPANVDVAAAKVPRAIGVCWQAGGWDAARSVPLASLLDVLPSDVALVSLQRGAASADAVSPRFVNPATQTATSFARHPWLPACGLS